jgi:hypothetical protein
MFRQCGTETKFGYGNTALLTCQLYMDTHVLCVSPICTCLWCITRCCTGLVLMLQQCARFRSPLDLFACWTPKCYLQFVSLSQPKARPFAHARPEYHARRSSHGEYRLRCSKPGPSFFTTSAL